MNKTVLITGATSGIGRATAQILAEKGYNIIITGRRTNRLMQLEKELHQKYKTRVLSLSFDVQDKTAVKKAIEHLPSDWKQIDILINNAGLASGFEKIHEGKLEDWEVMIDTNIKGLLYMTRQVVPEMVKAGSGHIINVGSIAGREVYPKGNIYCGTKHAVDALTKSMRIDLLEYGIKVTAINPGAVETEFSNVRFHGNSELANKVYKGYQPLTAEDVASCIIFSIETPPHVNINEILVMPAAQANATLFKKNG